MASLTKKFPSIKPQPLYEWMPSGYDMDKKLSTFRGEKWLSDQASFLMEMMKFQPNIRKEAYRKGLGDHTKVTPEPATAQEFIDFTDKERSAYMDYYNRVKPYDYQYVGLYGSNLRHIAGNPHEGGALTFGISHTFGRNQDRFQTQGFGAGAAVADDGTGVKKKQIYDFFLNFWDFGGSYKDYFHVGEEEQYSSSFFAHPEDLYSIDKNYYRSDYKYDYATGLESAQTIDRRYDAIPIFKRGTTWNVNGSEYFNSFEEGKGISSMTWEEYERFVPKDFTSSYFGRNPAILSGDEVPSLTGYDRINPKTGKTHFQEAIDYFSTYKSSKGKALVYDGIDKDGKAKYAEVERAGFHDLMMDPDAPWNSGGNGSGWWAGRTPEKKWEFENMKAAFYIVILAVEAKRRNLHAMTQWFGPHTQFQDFSFTTKTTRSGIGAAGSPGTGTYVAGADEYMIRNFRTWYGDTCQDRKVGDQSGQMNPLWRSAEAPQFRAEFNNVFMTGFHEMGSFMKSFCGGSGGYIYSAAEQEVVPRLRDWMLAQFKNLMDPEKIKETTLAAIHPGKAPQTAAKEEFKEFVDPPDITLDIDNSTGIVWNADNNNKFADQVTLSKNGSSTFSWSWTRNRDDMLTAHASSINSHYAANIASQKPDWATDDDLKNLYKSKLAKNFSGVSISSQTAAGSVSLTGLGDADINVNGGNRNSGDPVKVAEYSVSAYYYLKPNCSTAVLSKTVHYEDGVKQYRWKPGQSGDKPWVYQRRYFYPNKNNGSGEYTSWADQGSRSSLPDDVGGQHYDAVRSKTISWDDTKRYNDSAQIRTIEEKYKIEANMVWENQDNQWTKGHNIKVIPTYDIGSGDGTLSVTSHGIRTVVTYKDATDFRDAYEDFQANAAQPYQDMSLATYRMERDNPNGQSSIELPEHINTSRWAHQWYRKRADVENALGLDSNPELKRLYEGGAVAELFREYRTENESFADWRGDGTSTTDDVNPAATADFSKMMNHWISTNTKASGSWHITVGNLRKGIQDNEPDRNGNQGSGIYPNWSENWFHQYSYWNSSQIRNTETLWADNRDIQGPAYDNVWGLRVAYLMRNTTAYSVGYITFQQVIFRMKVNQRKQEMEEYKEQKHEEEREKAEDEKKSMENRAEFRSMMAEISKRRSQENARIKKMVMKEQKNRREQRAQGNKAQRNKKAAA